jgi:DNA-binding MarR family transcriptional regulator
MKAVSPAARMVDAGPEGLAGSVHDVMRSILRRLQPALEAEGISMGQFWGLHAISTLGPSSVNSVAHQLMVAPPTACANVDTLERAGLIERRRSVEDRRVVEVALTRKGRETEARIWRAIGEAMRHGTRDLPPGEIAVAARVFRHVVERLESDGRPALRGAA